MLLSLEWMGQYIDGVGVEGWVRSGRGQGGDVAGWLRLTGLDMLKRSSPHMGERRGRRGRRGGRVRESHRRQLTYRGVRDVSEGSAGVSRVIVRCVSGVEASGRVPQSPIKQRVESSDALRYKYKARGGRLFKRRPLVPLTPRRQSAALHFPPLDLPLLLSSSPMTTLKREHKDTLVLFVAKTFSSINTTRERNPASTSQPRRPPTHQYFPINTHKTQTHPLVRACGRVRVLLHGVSRPATRDIPPTAPVPHFLPSPAPHPRMAVAPTLRG
ncbi:hypothetical protein E2C01_034205 [Portunus trituberculatus]|uniref:Uncharacterized protein n=1 Tax=Portunus trituberculatus TaxID=210409 RepID=A0A5B7F284_PORTR|nr:hypothetical protein [Portunus trituberculatus]